MLFAVANNNHRPIIRIGNSLIRFLTFPEQADIHFLRRKHNRLNRIDQFINVKYLNTLPSHLLDLFDKVYRIIVDRSSR